MAGPNSGEGRVRQHPVAGRGTARGCRPWAAPLSDPDHHRPGPGHGLRLDEGPDRPLTNPLGPGSGNGPGPNPGFSVYSS